MSKIHIFFGLVTGPWGGANQFLKALRKYLISQDLYETDPLKATVLLFNSYPFREEWRFKRSLSMKQDNKLIIHRVAGPITIARNGTQWKYIDEIIYKFNKMAADGTIFQSRWSMEKNKQLGMQSNKYETIIPNAADPSIFSQKKEFIIRKKVKIVCSSWSANWNKGFKLYRYLDENLDFSRYEMDFIGKSPIKFNKITPIKPLPTGSLSKNLKRYDIYLTASKDEPCSNSLIEAISVGLPVIAINSGGNPEILEKTNAGILFNGKNDIINKIEDLVKNYSVTFKKIRPLTIDEVGKKYVKFIEKVEPWKRTTNGDIFRFMSYFYFKKLTSRDWVKFLRHFYSKMITRWR